MHDVMFNVKSASKIECRESITLVSNWRDNIIVSLESPNKPHPTMDFSLDLYVKHNVGLSALYSARGALYSALSPTLCLTYRTRVKSIVATGLFRFSSVTIICTFA